MPHAFAARLNYLAEIWFLFHWCVQLHNITLWRTRFWFSPPPLPRSFRIPSRVLAAAPCADGAGHPSNCLRCRSCPGTKPRRWSVSCFHRIVLFLLFFSFLKTHFPLILLLLLLHRTCNEEGRLGSCVAWIPVDWLPVRTCGSHKHWFIYQLPNYQTKTSTAASKTSPAS